MIFIRLFIEFFKVGLFSIGGGMATVPFLQSMAAKTQWFTSAQLADMIAVSESTPGPLGVNMASYVGYTTGTLCGGVGFGILGSAIATIGLITPSIIIIISISYFLDKFRKSKYVDAAFYGLRSASVGLIGAAGISIVLLCFFNLESIYQISSNTNFDFKNIILAFVILILTRWIPKTKKLHPIVFIIFSAIIGIIFKF